MRITIDEKNRRVIATGSWKGKRVKAIAVCHPDDTFDKEKGEKIAKAKYRLKELEAKKSIHESNVRALEQHIKWVQRVLKDEVSICDNMERKSCALRKEVEEEINKIVE